MIALILGGCLLADPTVGGSEDCGYGYAEIDVDGTLPAARVAGIAVTVDANIHEWEIDAHLTVENPSTEDCPVALYLAQEDVDLDLAPTLSDDAVPPDEVPGFGTRVDGVLLSRRWTDTNGYWVVEVVEPGTGQGERHLVIVGCEGLNFWSWGGVTSCDARLDRSVDVRPIE